MGQAVRNPGDTGHGFRDKGETSNLDKACLSSRAYNYPTDYPPCLYIHSVQDPMDIQHTYRNRATVEEVAGLVAEATAGMGDQACRVQKLPIQMGRCS
jgi:hypothetical protein